MRFVFILFFALFALPGLALAELNVPILLYHRLAATVVDSMTITTPVFESHLKYLKENGYTVIPLSRLIRYKQGEEKTPLPLKPVVIVTDDAHKSVYSDMLPLVKKYNVPVTLFVYPSAISNASYAMTWNELREVQTTGLFDIESHTFWHPNFKQEKKKQSPTEYDKFVTTQLSKSKTRLEKELGRPINLLAWPFGIYDDDLLRSAAGAGYIATFTIEGRPVRQGDPMMKLPRYLLSNNDRGERFAELVKNASGK